MLSFTLFLGGWGEGGIQGHWTTYSIDISFMGMIWSPLHVPLQHKSLDIFVVNSFGSGFQVDLAT